MIIAIDPGAVSGAIAFLDEMGGLSVADLPVVDGQVNAAALASLLIGCQPRRAVVERVGAMPKQGVSSTFKFGKSVGIIEGVLLGMGVPLTYVTPQVWKRYHKLGSDKEQSRALAIRLHPKVEGLHRKKDHGRAEALLMLDWYRSTGEK